MIWLNAQDKKSANWISTMGRKPTMAAPTAVPIMPVSEMGLSISRLASICLVRLSVTLNAPPYVLMSCPMRIICGFFFIFLAIVVWIA